MGMLPKLLVLLVPIVTTMVSVEGAITWHTSTTGASVGIADTEDTFSDAVDSCVAAGGVIWDTTIHTAEATFVKTIMVTNRIYWRRLTTNAADKASGCNQDRFYYTGTAFVTETVSSCNQNAYTLCHRPPNCNPPPATGICMEQERTDCSKTCGIGWMIVRYTCGTYTFDCNVKCCCVPCPGTGSGVPSHPLCGDVRRPEPAQCVPPQPTFP